MVNRLLSLSYHSPVLVLLLLIVTTFAAAPKLQYLQYDISAQSLIVKNSDAWNDYQHSLDTFGSDSAIIIVLNDEELFSQDKLLLIKNALKQFKQLDFVKNTSSLFSVPNVKDVDGYIESKPFLHEFPSSLDQQQLLIKEAIENSMVSQNLISLDGKSMAINLYIDALSTSNDEHIITKIDDVLNSLKPDFDHVYQMSEYYVRDQISRQIEIDQKTILPAALIVLLIVLGLSMGRLNCSIVPLSTAFISIVLTLAIMVELDLPINVLTSLIPALLIIIGSTEDVHLMAEYQTGLNQGLSRDQSVQKIPVNQSVAIMLAFVTTFLGFLSIVVNDLEILMQFGWMVSIGLTINFIVTILFVPAFLRLFGGQTVKNKNSQNSYQTFSLFLFSIVSRFKKTTLLFLLLISVFFIWGIQFIAVNNNTLDYFSDDSEVRQRAENLHNNLSGMLSFSIVLDSSIEGTFQKVRYLNEVEQIQQFIDERNVFDKTVSFADFIKLTHKVMEGTSKPELPLEDEVVGVYMSFVQFEAVESYVNSEYSSTRILVRHNIGDSQILQREFDAIEDFIANTLKSKLKVSLTGDSVLSNHAAQSMAIGQIQSLFIMVIVILFLVSILYVDLKAGFIALLPNVFPVIVLFGVMGYFKIPLDSGTTMVAVIALGICVDDTIHFLSRYHKFTRNTDQVEQALRLTIAHEATPITTTSIALALGFLALTLSSFQPVIYFGALSALVMMMALFSTFVITPVLLSFIQLITVWDNIALTPKSDILKNSAIFKGLSNNQIKKAILSGVIKNFNEHEWVVEQGEVGDKFYVLFEGKAKVTHKDEDGSVHTLAHLKEGDLFGELAHNSHHKRIARVSAETPIQVLELHWGSIRQLGKFHPRIALKLYHNLSVVLSKRVSDGYSERVETRDELSGAYTRPIFCELLQLQVKRSQYKDETLSMMHLSIEWESDIKNDAGYKANDNKKDIVINSITKIIQEKLSPVDIFARWDENSFMLLSPESEKENMINCAQSIQESFGNSKQEEGLSLHIYATVAQVQPFDTIVSLLERLENRLTYEKSNRKSLSVSVS